MKEPTVFEEALGSTLDAWKNDEIKKYDKALREAIKAKMRILCGGPIPCSEQAINEAEVEG